MHIAQLTMQVILDGLSRLGLDRLAITRRAQLPPLLPPHVDERALAAVWREARRQTQRQSIQLEVGLHTPEASFGLIYYLIASAATLREGLLLLQQLLPLAAPWAQISIEERDDEFVVACASQPSFLGRDEADLFLLGILLRRVQVVAVRPARLLRVELPVRAPADREAWRSLVDGVPLRFGARAARLVLHREDGELPMRRADPRLLALLKQQLGLADGPHDSLLAALRSLLRDRLAELPDLADAAPALGLSRRSLQRKLSEAGTTFERELNQVRREVAESLLAQSHVSLGEVSARVGFAEQASFSRAFLRWTGSTPSSARRRLLPSPSASH